MDIEYLFEAALVALGPPSRLPTASHRTGRISMSAGNVEKFNSAVGEYNAFVIEVHGLVMPEWSYEAYSRWFYRKRKPH